MDRRNSIALVLIMLIYWVWFSLKPTPEVVEEEPGQVAEQASPEAKPTTPAPAAAPAPPVPVVPPKDVKSVSFSSCETNSVLRSDGGGFAGVGLLNHREPFHVVPLYTYAMGLVTGSSEGPWKPYGKEPGPEKVLSEDGRALVVGSGRWGTASPNMELVESGESKVVFRGVDSNGIEITQTFERGEEKEGAPCTTLVSNTWKNTGSNAFQSDVWVAMHDSLAPAAGGMTSRYELTMRPMAYVDGDLEYGDNVAGSGEMAGCNGYQQAATTEAPLDIPGPASWIGIHDRYFGLLAIPSVEDGTAAFSLRQNGETPMPGVHWKQAVSLAPGESHTVDFTVYAGPLIRSELSAINENLTEAVDLGFFAIFAYPLLWLLNLWQSIVGNWGIAIMAMTITVKALFFPMTQNSFRSMQKMQILRPKIDKIQKDFKDDPMELNRQTMELFSKEGVNPISGCLPMFLQMPVWFSLYNVLLTSSDLYQTEFLYLRDLSAPDPYCVIPILIMGLFLLQQQFTTLPDTMDPAQRTMMKWMPVVFGLFFFALPSGLGVYVFINVSLSILQQWWIKRGLETPEEAQPAV